MHRWYSRRHYHIFFLWVKTTENIGLVTMRNDEEGMKDKWMECVQRGTESESTIDACSFFMLFTQHFELIMYIVPCALCCSQPVYGKQNSYTNTYSRRVRKHNEIEVNESQSEKWWEGESLRTCNYVYSIFFPSVAVAVVEISACLRTVGFSWGINCCGFSFRCEHFFSGGVFCSFLLLQLLT